ncbi:type I polyketide synthase [Catenulispora yoronensis]
MMAENQQLLDYLKKVAADLYETRERLRELEAGEQEPIAIVGMGCRLPGGVADPDQFWELLAAGGDAIGAFPADRGWDVIEESFGLNQGTEGQDAYSRTGGFVHEAPEFDAGFFGISPREALAMDPQQRILLEVAWETLEHGGVNPASLKGTKTGVFVGANSSGYGTSLVGSGSAAEGYVLTGGLTAVISGRVSYTLGLEGPAVTVDTACSSASVALHLACQSLRTRESELALAGGVAVMALPGAFAEFSKQQGMAADGRCKAFGAGADGIGWAEGSGMVLLERLSDARRNNHQILAVIRGTAVNQDGASNGLSAPNGPAQQRVIRAALAHSHLSPADVDAVEAHGTGTTLGDPIEAGALLATYGQDRPEDQPLWLGSVKSNIGHPQTASGAVSLIKVVLALRNELLPPTLHAAEPSPHIDWTEGNVQLLQEARPWPKGERTRRAGISAFGISGTNVHMIVEEAPEPEAAETESAETSGDGSGAQTGQNSQTDQNEQSEQAARTAAPKVLTGGDVRTWLVSGRGADGLAAQAARLRESVAGRPGLDLADVGWTLANFRATFENRAVVIGAQRDVLQAGLAAVATGQPDGAVVSGAVPAAGLGRTAFVFPGQGSQWVGMGRELLATSPVFAARFAECAEALAPFVDWSLYELLDQQLETADQVQPVLWAMMVSLAAVWQAVGVTPDAVVGHSQGEIAAAVVAGILSLEDGARVVALRSQALKPLAGKGGMLSIALPVDAVRGRIAEFGDRVSVAAVNGAKATVVSGEPEALQEIKAAAEAEDIRARIIPVDYASHCAQIDALESDIKRALAEVRPAAAVIPMISAMSGEWLSGPEADAGYWYASLRSPVEFDRALRTLAAGGHQVFIEVSPHPVLTGGIAATFEDLGTTTPVVTGTLRRDEGGPARLIASLAEAHVHGVPIDWTTVLPHGDRTALPTYAFQHQRYWAEAMPGTRSAASATAGPGSAAEAAFWAAVEEGDLRDLADRLSVDDDRLAELLPALASWRRRERAESAVADWRYRVTWVPAPDTGATVLSGTWLAVIPQAGPATEDASESIMGAIGALNERGVSVLTIDVGPDELDRAALAAVLAEAAQTARVTGVISFLAVDETPVPGHPAVPAGTAGTLLLVQALGDAGIAAPLWVVTLGAVATGAGETPASAAQAQVWGLGRVAGLEHLDRWGGLIDLPSEWDDRVAARLCAALGTLAEDQVAIRPSGTLARRLIRARARRADAGLWTPTGTVLVTGATGEIGPYLGRWLAARGADHVVLTSRSGPWVAGGEAADAVAELLARMAGSGTGVSLLACDLTQRSEVAALLDRIAADGPPLKTVLHAANAGRMVSYDGTDLRDLDVALGAKGVGAVILDELTQDLDLDHFVLFSSIAATWGSAEHAAYAAGNAFLDALAQRRRACGLPATSIAWGVWDTQEWTVAGAVVPDGPGVVTPARLMRQGMNFLATDRAVAALEQVLADNETFIAVADVDWARFAPVFRASRNWPLFDGLPEVRALAAAPAAMSTDPDTTATGGLAGQLAVLAAADRERLVVDLVRTNAAAVLGHPSADAVDPGRAFRDMGFDSLTAVDLRNRLNVATGLALPSTVVFDYPSATVLARQIITQLLGAAPAARTPVLTASIGAAASDEPIAIIGMGCRFPGGVASPEQLWDLVAAGGDAISGFPTDRGWDMTGLFDPDPDNPGTSYVQEGGFLHGAAQFDPGFFGISPREAIAMDPQQRMLLEVCWEALERAGIDPEALRGTLTGVFAGASPSGYAGQVVGIEGAEGHLITGNIASVLSGRVSYTLGLEGPAVTVDTACSSSLVALHLACQSLHTGESTMALAGGVMVMADPTEFVGFSRQRALAADGRCKAFSDDADGMGIAEGAGMILLERLSDAQRLGHPVLAVVKGSAMNQDGASNGLTAPNGPSQQRVIRAALANAQLVASEVDAVEAHGTGTALGDPIEAQALLATYGQDRPEDQPLWLGSVKSNIGHTQQAAGIAGVIKMVQALRQDLLPATLHAGTPSSHIDWTLGDVRLLTEPVAWPHADGRPRRAGVSAFGLSGTNAHVILEEAPAAEEATDDAGDHEAPVLAGSDVSAWVVSGRGADGLAGQAGRLREHVLAHRELEKADVAWSLAATRGRFDHRAVVVGRGREDLTAGLAAVATKQTSATVVTGVVRGTPRVGFVFAGQGAQRAGMGRGLYAASPVFARTFDRVAAVLEAELGLPVADVVLGRAKDVDADQTVFAQTGLFAVQVALVEMLAAAGVRPDAVAGHSVGEIAASWAAGVLSLEDACRLVANRARLMQSLPEGGGMCSIAATEAEVLDSMVELGVEGVGIGAVNGPRSTVVSGVAAGVDRVAELWRERGRRVRPLRVSHAFHSVLMDPILAELGAVAADLAYAPARIPWAQAATGQVVADCAPSYWTEQARQPVRFADAAATLAERGVSVFLEIGPDGTLSAIGTAAVPAGTGATFIPLLRSKSPAPVTVATALGRAHVLGVDVDWEAVLGTGARVDLPTYAFQHQSFWPQGGHAVQTGTAETAAESDFWAAVEDGDVSQLAGTLAIDGERLAELLPALASWRRREREDSAVADWRYRITWVPVTDPGAAVLSGTWLAVVPSGLEAAVSDYLRALTDRGATVVTLAVEQSDLDRTALGRNLSQVAATAEAPIAGILSLLALDESPLGDRPAVHAAVAGTLLLVQALGDAGITAPLWSATRGAVATGQGDALESPVQAQVWGLGRVVGLEHSERWGGLVDLPGQWDERVAARFCAVLSGFGEDQVAVRPSGMVARRLVRAPHPRESAPWTPRGSVLITGGTGGIGSLVARWAVGRGAERVVLTSRSGAGAAGVAGLAAELAVAGTAVDIVACDMSRRDAVSGLLNRIAATGSAPSSVIHAAGVGEATAIEEFTLDRLAHVSAVKTTGAVLLDELTAGLELDAFVLFSSVSATWGSGLQPGYAAANAFLDALAETRRARGQAATSVAWGLWGGAGMGAGEAGRTCTATACGRWTPSSVSGPWRRRSTAARPRSPSPTSTGSASPRSTPCVAPARCWSCCRRSGRRWPAAARAAARPWWSRRASWCSGWRPPRAPTRTGCWSSWCAPRPRRCSGTPRSTPWRRTARSTSSASTR